jgi:hypothetical protein
MKVFGIFSSTLVVVGILAGVNARDIWVEDSVVEKVSIGGTIAEVFRTFALKNIEDGYHTLIIDHITSSLDEKSIQVKGMGAAEVLGMVMQKQQVLKENDPVFNDLTIKLYDIIKGITDALNSMRIQRESVMRRMDSLNSYTKDALQTNTHRPEPLTLAKVSELLDYQQQELAAAGDKVAKLDAAIKYAEKLQGMVQAMREGKEGRGIYKNLFAESIAGGGQDIQRQHFFTEYPALYTSLLNLPKEEIHWPDAKQANVLHVNIKVHSTAGSAAGSNLAFTLQYMSFPATWRPEYDVRLNSHFGTGKHGDKAPTDPYALQVALYAVVQQSTQEHWNSVQLNLSTAQPQQHIAAPAGPTRLALSYQPEYQPPPPQPRAYMKQQRMHGGQPEMLSFARSSAYNGAEGDMMDHAAAMGGAAGSVKSAMFAPTSAAATYADVEMEMADAGMSGTGGSIGAAVVFSPKYAVNITSNEQRRAEFVTTHSGSYKVNEAPQRSTRLFIREMELPPPRVFTYIVPTGGDAQGFLKAWCPATSSSSSSSSAAQVKATGISFVCSSNLFSFVVLFFVFQIVFKKLSLLVFLSYFFFFYMCRQRNCKRERSGGRDADSRVAECPDLHR